MQVSTSALTSCSHLDAKLGRPHSVLTRRSLAGSRDAHWLGVGLLRVRDVRAGIGIARSARLEAILIGCQPHDPIAAQQQRQLAEDPVTAHIPGIALGPSTWTGASRPKLPRAFLTVCPNPFKARPTRALELALQRVRSERLRATVIAPA